MIRNYWSREDLEKLFDLRARFGPIWIKFVEHFPGRTSQQIAAAYNNHRDRATGLLRKQTAAEVHESAIAARDRRADVSHRTLTASVFGDPLPGRSALDLKSNSLFDPAGGTPGQHGGMTHERAE